MQISKEQLRSIVERIERLIQEKQNIADDIKRVYAEAKGNGFDPKAIKEVIRIRAKDKAELEEEEHILHTYMLALGMLPE